jgi:hypothetical protein
MFYNLINFWIWLVFRFCILNDEDANGRRFGNFNAGICATH